VTCRRLVAERAIVRQRETIAAVAVAQLAQRERQQRQRVLGRGILMAAATKPSSTVRPATLPALDDVAHPFNRAA